MGNRDFVEWQNDSSAPVGGNRTHDVDPGRREVRQRLEEAEQEARKLREVPMREGNPYRRWRS